MNLSPKLRGIIYSLSVIVTPVVAYLGTEGRITTFAVGLYAVINMAVLGLARINVSE